MIKNILEWLNHRTGYKKILREALYERIPGGARWRYVWGSTLVFTFAVQVITGTFLLAAYSPSAQTAWESVYFIDEVMFLGCIVRGIHHFSAQAMVVLLGIHLMQVIIDGAYKAPREINFWLGLILMQIVLGLSLTGYLLPWDQKGYYATKVSTNILGATPLIGPQLQELVQGGPEYGHHTLTRFLAMHVVVLPASLIGFLGLHIYLFRRHGITVKDPYHAPDTTFWPNQVLKDGVACLGVLAVVLFLTIFIGAQLSAPANPEGYAAARPEWYFLFLFRFLKFEAVGIPFGAIYVPGILMTIIALMPIIAWWKGGHKFNVGFMWFMAACFFGLTTLAMIEDSTNPDHQAAITEANRDSQRIRELAERPSKIPVEGAVTLLRDDPFTQGPRIFAKHCATCHRYDGHDGRGRIPMETNDRTEKQVVSLPTATDLGNFGSREWMRSIIIDYSNHFAALKNAAWYTKAKNMGQSTKDGKSYDEVYYLDPETSEMADWSKANNKQLLKPVNKDSLAALLEFMVSQSGRKDLQLDKRSVKKGWFVANNGTLAVGEIEACTGCHETLGNKFESTGQGTGYPDLAGYGSFEWLMDFISNPGSNQHYGVMNRMPGFGNRMTKKELELLVKWFVKDYYPTSVNDYPSKKMELTLTLKEQQSL